MGHNPRVLVIKNRRDAEAAISRIGSDKTGASIMGPKALFRVISISGVDWRAANLIKQDMLARGGDAAVPWDVQEKRPKETEILLMGTAKQFKSLIGNLRLQPYGMKAIGADLKTALDAYETAAPEKTKIMGILNVTPNSFSDGGKFADKDSAVARAIQMAKDGADIIDIGGESTRPGAEPVSVDEELKRVIPVIEEIVCEVDLPISIDTMKADVAEAAIEAGAAMINDVSAMRFDPAMAGVAAKSGGPVVLMHMKGTPRDMQDNPEYDSLMGEIISFLDERALAAIEAGVAPENIIVDPGIGFGKTLDHNLEILRRLPELKSLGYPILVGASRKAFIGAILGTEPDDRIEGTVAAVTAAVMNGASIVRVHDVKEMARAARVADAIANAL